MVEPPGAYFLITCYTDSCPFEKRKTAVNVGLNETFDFSAKLAAITCGGCGVNGLQVNEIEFYQCIWSYFGVLKPSKTKFYSKETTSSGVDKFPFEKDQSWEWLVFNVKELPRVPETAHQEM
jgi:hypothetical protein